MPAFNDGFLDLPERPGKPRAEGLTHVIDKGLGPRAVEDLLETAGAYIDIVKLGWGTGVVTPNLAHKLEHTDGGADAHAKHMRDQIVPGMAKLRDAGDALEMLVPHGAWPLPTYREMLFIK